MGRLILVTGGARSGKSTFAEEYVKKLGNNVLYIATSIVFDDEMKLRIKKHREQRPKDWTTLEAYKDMDVHLENSLSGVDASMLDCITIMVTNLMMEKCWDWDKLNADNMMEMEEYVRTEIDKLIVAIKKSSVPFVLVTNEIGMGVVPEYASGRLFRDIAGRANQVLAKEADEVYLCISGIPMKIKG